MKRNKPLVRRVGPKRKMGWKPSGTRGYYLDGVERSTWVCENCGDPIPHGTERDRFTAQAHILPKDDFPSVKLHPENRLHLCLRCHNDWDNSWAKAFSMPVVVIAIVRFRTFMHYIPENEVKLLPDKFYEELLLEKNDGSK